MSDGFSKTLLFHSIWCCGSVQIADSRHKATLENMSVSGGAGGDKEGHPGGRDSFFFLLKYFLSPGSAKPIVDCYSPLGNSLTALSHGAVYMKNILGYRTLCPTLIGFRSDILPYCAGHTASYY